MESYFDLEHYRIEGVGTRAEGLVTHPEKKKTLRTRECVSCY